MGREVKKVRVWCAVEDGAEMFDGDLLEDGGVLKDGILEQEKEARRMFENGGVEFVWEKGEWGW